MNKFITRGKCWWLTRNCPARKTGKYFVFFLQRSFVETGIFAGEGGRPSINRRKIDIRKIRVKSVFHEVNVLEKWRSSGTLIVWMLIDQTLHLFGESQSYPRSCHRMHENSLLWPDHLLLLFSNTVIQNTRHHS